MKPQTLFKLILLAVAFSAISCKESGQKLMLSSVTGATNEIMLIMNKVLWDGPVGDTIKSYFEQEQLGLPQPEPMFDVINLPLANFEKNVKQHRNVLVVEISSRVDSVSFQFRESPWARTQKYFKITAPSDTAFFRVFDANREKIMAVFLKAERDRLIDVYKKTPDTKIFNTFKNKYNIILNCPGDYKINKDTNDFVWLSAETKIDSKGIVFFQEEYKHESQLNYQVIIDRMNDELKKYIPGPRKNTWMALDMDTPVSAATYNYEGLYYAVAVRGLWIAANDYMGGPYVLNVVLDEQRNRIIYMMAYVYAPDGRKRNMLRQVETILYTMQINYDNAGEQPVKEAAGK